MNNRGRYHGHDGRFPTKPPPWKYKTMYTENKYKTTYNTTGAAIFSTFQWLQTTHNEYGPTTTATTTTPREIKHLSRDSCIYHDKNAPAPVDQHGAIPPISRISPTDPSPSAPPPPPSPDAAYHAVHPQHQLPAQKISARHPSDSERYLLGRPSEFNTSDRHPSDQHPALRHATDQNTTTIIHNTSPTPQDRTQTSIIYMCNPPPFAAIAPISYISTLLSHDSTQHCYEFPRTTEPTPTPSPAHSICLTSQLRAQPRTQHTHITCPTLLSSPDGSLSTTPLSSPHIFPCNPPPMTTPIGRRRPTLTQQHELQLRHHTRRNSDHSRHQPIQPSNTRPMVKMRLPMTAKLGIWCTIIAFSTRTNNTPPLLQPSKNSQFNGRPPPPPPASPPQQQPRPSPTMPSRTPADSDPGTAHALEDPDLRDFHDAILPDDPPEPGDPPHLPATTTQKTSRTSP